MNIFSNIFRNKSRKPSQKNTYTNKYNKGKRSFEIGKKLFSHATMDSENSQEKGKVIINEALSFFDKSISYGYNEDDVYFYRGMCLRDLDFEFDAIEDFNICISKNPDCANYYYVRAMSKQHSYDYIGSISDFQEAISLSKLNNEETKYWNDYAKRTGFNSATQKYEIDLKWLLTEVEIYNERIERNKEYYTKEYEELKSRIKRRK
jgi:tetratricopeptide (TPR) repeat protein